LIERRERNTVRLCERKQVTVGDLLWALHPSREIAGVLIVGYELEVELV
jgi:hypothetical protein